MFGIYFFFKSVMKFYFTWVQNGNWKRFRGRDQVSPPGCDSPIWLGSEGSAYWALISLGFKNERGAPVCVGLPCELFVFLSTHLSSRTQSAAEGTLAEKTWRFCYKRCLPAWGCGSVGKMSAQVAGSPGFHPKCRLFHPELPPSHRREVLWPLT